MYRLHLGSKTCDDRPPKRHEFSAEDAEDLAVRRIPGCILVDIRTVLYDQPSAVRSNQGAREDRPRRVQVLFGPKRKSPLVQHRPRCIHDFYGDNAVNRRHIPILREVFFVEHYGVVSKYNAPESSFQPTTRPTRYDVCRTYAVFGSPRMSVKWL
jgi:hypothetical protein